MSDVDVLMSAAYDGDAEAISAVLARGASVNAVDGNSFTALAYAAQLGHLEAIGALLRAGADTRATVRGATPLYLAVQSGRLEAAETLAVADPGAVDVARPGGITPLMVAALIGRVDLVRHLLAAGASVRAVDDKGSSALYLAAQAAHADVVRDLLAAGSVVDQPRTDGYAAGTTPLCIAAEKGSAAVVSLLIDAGAAIDHSPADGGTPLIASAQRGHVEVVKLLLAAGVNTECRLIEPAEEYAIALHSTPLWLAAFFGQHDVAVALLAGGASPLARCATGQTPAEVVCQAAPADHSREEDLRALLTAAEATAMAAPTEPLEALGAVGAMGYR